MARPLRYLTGANALVEVTTRTLHGRPLLKPSAELNDLVVGILGRALDRHPAIELHAVGHLSNHVHLLLSAPDAGVLASFMCFVNGNIAREAGALYDWKEKFWGRRYRAIEVLDDTAAVARLRYLLGHGCKEGFVTQPSAWYGVNCVPALLGDEPLRGTWYDRTIAYEARRRGVELDATETATEYEIDLAPLPAWRQHSDEERQALVRAMLTDIEREAAASRPAPKRRGAKARNAAEDPHRRPPRVKRSPATPCHATFRDTRERFCAAYAAFVDLFRRAAGEHRTRPPAELFPGDCFPPAHGFLRPAASTAARAST